MSRPSVDAQLRKATAHLSANSQSPSWVSRATSFQFKFLYLRVDALLQSRAIIGESMKSILQQPDCPELILTDEGLTDRLLALLQAYCRLRGGISESEA